MPQLVRQATVVRDGLHNAFTCLAWWQGQYHVAYRKSEAHYGRANGRVMIANSMDRHRFREVATLKTRGDCRDPLLVPFSQERLAVLFPVADPVLGNTRCVQYLAWTEDGFTWSRPQAILPPDYHLFRVRPSPLGWLGLACYRQPDARALYLMRSADLEQWTTVCKVGPDELWLNEADLCLQPDGEAWLIARTLRKPDNFSMFGVARPPYDQWTLSELGTTLHCPRLLAHQGQVYLAARCYPRQWGEAAWPWGASLGVFTVTRGAVAPLLRIPAAGDCAYPGLVVDDAGRVCLSYYSQHAYLMGVIPPDDARVVVPPGERQPAQEGTVTDVYFAELALP
jgi:hypothetical protein